MNEGISISVISSTIQMALSPQEKPDRQRFKVAFLITNWVLVQNIILT